MNCQYWIVGAYLLILLPLILFSGRINAVWLKLFLAFLSFELMLQVALFICAPQNKALYHFGHLYFEYIFYLILYYSALKTKVLRLFVLLFLLWIILVPFFADSYQQFSKEIELFGAFALLLCALLFMGEQLLKNEIVNILRLPMFWISIAMLFSFISSLCYVNWLNLHPHYSAIGYNKWNNSVFIFFYFIQNLFILIGITSNIIWQKLKA